MGFQVLSWLPLGTHRPLQACLTVALGLLAGVAVPVHGAPPAVPAAPERAVTPTAGLVTIESDVQRADNKTGVITATGNVRIVYPDQRVVATARQAQYFSQEGRVILSGDVDIVQTDGHALRAERVIYEVATERLVALPPSGDQVFSKVRLPQSADPAPAGSTP